MMNIYEGKYIFQQYHSDREQVNIMVIENRSISWWSRTGQYHGDREQVTFWWDDDCTKQKHV